jgi:hypothetical protein
VKSKKPWHIRNGLNEMAPKLSSIQAARAWKALEAAHPQGYQREETFAAFAPCLDSVSRNENAMRFAIAHLDESSSGSDRSTEPFVRCISSARSLARLLSHPGCVDGMREEFLQRFEELVIYDGKPVFPIPRARVVKKKSDSSKSSAKSNEAGHSPPRQFRTQHDAAVWIQQNWPDFDLEATYPATWRGSR